MSPSDPTPTLSNRDSLLEQLAAALNEKADAGDLEPRFSEHRVWDIKVTFYDGFGKEVLECCLAVALDLLARHRGDISEATKLTVGVY